MWVLGQDVNLVWAVLVFFTVWMLVYNLALGWASHRLPTALVELFYYGKAGLKLRFLHSLNRLAAVPLTKME